MKRRSIQRWVLGCLFLGLLFSSNNSRLLAGDEQSPQSVHPSVVKPDERALNNSQGSFVRIRSTRQSRNPSSNLYLSIGPNQRWAPPDVNTSFITGLAQPQKYSQLRFCNPQGRAPPVAA
ncbi:MAG TPA: hypothetical protein VGN86_15700 [Pyrinomonadaceae bacterium]|nr:hypothetical protein [Pyrinomonadaceae bacterium]